ncbi:hypothetical protein IGI04_039805 [Brassica rapa subsp. trilocularis]|uniref:Uncharacterized protein n=1 Tax=Brassica rapa subsp. trilocularis TaxID=1813537 RepID=A0ABQ7KPL5_BRACM|nr:hypothetical protein IGI04_039805 [Brassica rapa subsp. trilocularis]
MASDPKLKAEKGPDGLAITLSLDLCVHEPETKSVLDSSSPAAANANQTHPEKTEGKEGGKEHGQRPATAEGESKSRKKPQFQGRGRGIGIMNKGRGGWTGAGFDVDGRT